MNVEARLSRMGLELPEPPAPAGNYKRAVMANGLVFLSGQFPIRNGKLEYAGQVGADLTPEQGYAAAQLAALNVLGQLKLVLDDLGRLNEIVRVEGHVASAPGFNEQPRVLNGASELFAHALENRAGHARSAFAPSRLPLNAAIELVVTASIRE